MKIGGEELSTLSLAKEMVGRGHVVFVMGSKGPMYDEFINAGAQVELSSRPFRRNIAGILADARDIADIVRRGHIDIVHSQSVFPTLSAFWALRKMSRRPKLIFHDRGIGKHSYPVVAKWFNYLVDCVITNSDFEATLLNNSGLQVPCIRIHNCFNTSCQAGPGKDIRSEFGIDRTAKVIGIVGRLAEQKGHAYLLEAFRQVLDNCTDRNIILLIVGDGPLREKLNRTAHKLSLENHVVFAGFRRDMEHVYPALDMLLVPSIFEPFGNVAVEGGAYGIPVIASSVGGLPEALMHGESGLLVPPRDAEKLAGAITHLLEYPDVAQQLGAHGREFATTYFTSKRVADEVVAVYDSMLGGEVS